MTRDPKQAKIPFRDWTLAEMKRHCLDTKCYACPFSQYGETHCAFESEPIEWPIYMDYDYVPVEEVYHD
jgi:hypothetical protein